MKITIIGAGCMGSIYGCLLSKYHEVNLIDTNPLLVDSINRDGIYIHEEEGDSHYFPQAYTNTKDTGQADLLILFVKSLYSRIALESCRELIGDQTYILTLQNGSGHENIISEFIPDNRIIIGTTEDNGAILTPGHIRHGGKGITNIGMISDIQNPFLIQVKEAFDQCGFHTIIHENIQLLIWDKLFTNVSLSVLTGILQVPMGYIASNTHAWQMAERLIREAVDVAAGLGLFFDLNTVLNKVKSTSLSSPDGYTSIYADLKHGRKTEVDTISGSVVRASKKCGVPAPTHEFVVNVVHAMEDKAGLGDL